MLGPTSNVGMKEADRHVGPVFTSEARRQVLLDRSRGESSAIDRDGSASDIDVDAADRLCREECHRVRKLESGDPSIGRVVVSLYHHDGNLVFGKRFTRAPEGELCPQTLVRRVVDIAGQKQEVSAALDAERD